MNRLLKTFFFCVLGLMHSVQATPVVIYSSPAWVSGDGSTQVETIGILKYAYSAYNSGTPGTLAVNGCANYQIMSV